MCFSNSLRMIADAVVPSCLATANSLRQLVTSTRTVALYPNLEPGGLPGFLPVDFVIQ